MNAKTCATILLMSSIACMPGVAAENDPVCVPTQPVGSGSVCAYYGLEPCTVVYMGEMQENTTVAHTTGGSEVGPVSTNESTVGTTCSVGPVGVRGP